MVLKKHNLCRSLVILAVVFTAPLFAQTDKQEQAPPIKPDNSLPARFKKINLDALALAVGDLSKEFPDRYPHGAAYIETIQRYCKMLPEIRTALDSGDAKTSRLVDEILAFQQKAMLENPLLDFQKLLLIKRVPVGDPRRSTGEDKGVGIFLGLARQSSWQIDTLPNIHDWDNEIALLSPLNPDAKLRTFYRPPAPELLADLELNYNAKELTFSMPGDNKCWQVFEMDVDSRIPYQLTPKDQPDVHNFNSFYLPNGNVGFLSTAGFQGVPCNASVNVAMLYCMDSHGQNIRQLAFDQDHNYCPTVTNDGRILYLRWEYTDIPHVWARYLFTMNPDGTAQHEFYGSGSFWPNSIFFARPIPDHPTKFVGVVTGHHVGRVGELILFDPAVSRYSADGVIQRIPGRGKKVLPLIEDKLTENSWPKYLHPWPLSDKYFIVSAKPTPTDLWGIYLVDVFDNITLIKELDGYALMDPIPLAKRPTPPVIADRVDLTRKDALFYLEDIYAGPGLKDVPKGAVKNLRLFTYHFAYQRLAGISHRVGTDGPWEPKRVIGTVPVETDGSAFFRAPANTPISIQPLDADGKALQLMRSWTTAMPGEIVSCVGCHEKQNSTAPAMMTIAARKEPVEIQPWYGPVRGFSFVREVQPVLDKYCTSCHNGKPQPDGKTIPDFRPDRNGYMVLKNTDPEITFVENTDINQLFAEYGGVFPPAYVELRRYVRVGGLESDIRLLAPKEFHTDTSELFQILNKDHYGVRLDPQSWDRLITWVDLNAPCHGTWRETAGAQKTQRDHDRRIRLKTLYAGLSEDLETIPDPPAPVTRVAPKPFTGPPLVDIDCPDFPLDSQKAKFLQTSLTTNTETAVNLADGIDLNMVLIPAGKFVMGDYNGFPDEYPTSLVTIDKPFWMGKFEITNAQYALYDPHHDSRYEHKGSWSFSENHLGWPLNTPSQPVVRISQKQALDFCKGLSQKTGRKVTLPTEAQWEYACRAQTATPFFYGDLDTDFSPYANLADATIKQYAYDTDGRYTADILPRDDRFDDRTLVTAPVGSYKPNPWGLCDMHGNVWEWTRSQYKPYPYKDTDGGNAASGDSIITARGGSWYDRPRFARSAVRQHYPNWQDVYNVGFRVIIELPDKNIALAKAE
jgi:formylglycine-generating enzyme required for sulfatase activity